MPSLARLWSLGGRLLVASILAALVLAAGSGPARAATCAPLSYGAAPTQAAWVGKSIDCYTVQASEWVWAQITVATDAAGGVGQRVFDPAGKLMCTTVGADCQMRAAGTYRIEVWAAAKPADQVARPYSIAVQNRFRPENCARLAPGRAARTGPAPEQAADCFRIVVPDEDEYRVDWTLSGHRLTIAAGYIVCDSRVVSACTLAPGTYGVTITGARGPYTLNVVSANGPPATGCPTIERDQPVTDAWTGRTPDCFELDGRSGQRIAVAVEATTSEPPARRVYRPDGSVLCASGGYEVLLCTLDRSGAWKILTADKAPESDTATRPYRLTLHTVPSAPRCPQLAGDGVERTGTHVAGRPTCHSVAVGAGERALLKVKASGGVVATVVGPEGAPINCAAGCQLGEGTSLIWIDGRAGEWSLASELWVAPGCRFLVAGYPESAESYKTLRPGERLCMMNRGAAGDRVTVAAQVTGSDAPAAKQILRRDGSVLCASGAWAPLRCTLDRSDGFLSVAWHKTPSTPGDERSLLLHTFDLTHVATTGPGQSIPCELLRAGSAKDRGDAVRYSTPDTCLRVINDGATPLVVGISGSGLSSRVLRSDASELCASASEYCEVPPGAWATIIVSGRGTWTAWSAQRPSACDRTDLVNIAIVGQAVPDLAYQGARQRCLPIQTRAATRLSVAVDTTSTKAPGKVLRTSTGEEICRSGSWAPMVCTVPRRTVVWLETWYKPVPASATDRHDARVTLQDLADPGECRTLARGASISGTRLKRSDPLECVVTEELRSTADLRATRGGADMVLLQPGAEGSEQAVTSDDWIGLAIDPTTSPTRYAVWIGGSPGDWKLELGRRPIVRAPGISELAAAPGATQLRLASNARGDAAVAWLQPGSTGVQLWAAVRRPGGGWGDPARISSATATASDPSFGIDGDGNVTALWRQVEGTSAKIAAATLPVAASAWATPSTLATSADVTDPVLAVALSGRRAATWRRSTGRALSESASASATWSTATSAPDLPGRPELGIDDAGDLVLTTVHALIEDSNVIAAATKLAGGSWSAVQDLQIPDDTYYVSGGKLLVAPGGHTVLTFLAVAQCFCWAGGVFQLSWTPGGAWSEPTFVMGGEILQSWSSATDRDGGLTVAGFWTTQPGPPQPSLLASTLAIGAPLQTVKISSPEGPGPDALDVARDDAGRSVIVRGSGAGFGISMHTRGATDAQWSAETSLSAGTRLAVVGRDLQPPLVRATAPGTAATAWLEGDADGDRVIVAGVIDTD